MASIINTDDNIIDEEEMLPKKNTKDIEMKKLTVMALIIQINKLISITKCAVKKCDNRAEYINLPCTHFSVCVDCFKANDLKCTSCDTRVKFVKRIQFEK